MTRYIGTFNPGYRHGDPHRYAVVAIGDDCKRTVVEGANSLSNAEFLEVK